MFVVNNTSLISISPVFCATFLQPFFYLYPISTPPSSFSFQSYFPFLQFFYITFLYYNCSRHMQSETAYFYMQLLFYLLPLGTPFMVRLHEQLKFFVNYKISTDLAWQGLRIYLSGHEVCATSSLNFCHS